MVQKRRVGAREEDEGIREEGEGTREEGEGTREEGGVQERKVRVQERRVRVKDRRVRVQESTSLHSHPQHITTHSLAHCHKKSLAHRANGIIDTEGLPLKEQDHRLQCHKDQKVRNGLRKMRCEYSKTS